MVTAILKMESDFVNGNITITWKITGPGCVIHNINALDCHQEGRLSHQDGGQVLYCQHTGI